MTTPETHRRRLRLIPWMVSGALLLTVIALSGVLLVVGRQGQQIDSSQQHAEVVQSSAQSVASSASAVDTKAAVATAVAHDQASILGEFIRQCSIEVSATGMRQACHDARAQVAALSSAIPTLSGTVTPEVVTVRNVQTERVIEHVPTTERTTATVQLPPAPARTATKVVPTTVVPPAVTTTARTTRTDTIMQSIISRSTETVHETTTETPAPVTTTETSSYFVVHSTTETVTPAPVTTTETATTTATTTAPPVTVTETPAPVTTTEPGPTVTATTTATTTVTETCIRVITCPRP